MVKPLKPRTEYSFPYKPLGFLRTTDHKGIYQKFDHSYKIEPKFCLDCGCRVMPSLNRYSGNIENYHFEMKIDAKEIKYSRSDHKWQYRLKCKLHGCKVARTE